MLGETENTRGGTRRSRPETAFRKSGRSLRPASGIPSGNLRKASSCGSRCTRLFASLEPPLGSCHNQAYVHTYAFVGQSIGDYWLPSVTTITGPCDAAYFDGGLTEELEGLEGGKGVGRQAKIVFAFSSPLVLASLPMKREGQGQTMLMLDNDRKQLYGNMYDLGIIIRRESLVTCR